MQHSQIVLSLLLVTGGDATELLQPVDRPLHQVTQPIQGTIERDIVSFVAFPRDGVPNASPSEIGANLATTVTLIATDPFGPYTGTTSSLSSYCPATHQLFEYTGLVLLTGCQNEGHRFAGAFDSYMDFGAKTSSGAT